MDWKFWLPFLVQLLFVTVAVTGLYYRFRFRVNQHDKDINQLTGKVQELDRRMDDKDKESAKALNELERRLEKRLNRIEKILIKIDERMKTNSAGELLD